MLIFAIMGWIGCQSAAGEVSINQPADIANNVRIMIGLIYGICCLAQYLSIKFVYNLDKETVRDMQVKLGRVNEVDVFAQQED